MHINIIYMYNIHVINIMYINEYSKDSFDMNIIFEKFKGILNFSVILFT